MGPDIPADIEVRDLDREVRAELRSLPKGAADGVARHLVAAGRFLDTDPARALEHAQAARAQAARIASVREAVGIAAYHAGEWKLAISELRAWRRLTGSDAHLAVIADSERALGRPEKAIELAASPEASRLDTETRVELLIVASGARQDLGDVPGALSTLDVPELRSQRAATWLARLRYAYAELLLAEGRAEDAREWFVQAADADADGETDADERVLDLDGFLFTDEGDDDADDDLDGEDAELRDAAEDAATEDADVHTAADDTDDADTDDVDADDDDADDDDADVDGARAVSTSDSGDEAEDDEDVAEVPTDEQLAVAGADASGGSVASGPTDNPAVDRRAASFSDGEKFDGGGPFAG